MSSNASSVTACIAAVAAEESSREACSGATAGGAERSRERVDPVGDVQGRGLRAHEANVRHRVGCSYGRESRVQRFSSIVETGCCVAVAAKLIAPAAKTFAPAGVS